MVTDHRSLLTVKSKYFVVTYQKENQFEPNVKTFSLIIYKLGFTLSLLETNFCYVNLKFETDRKLSPLQFDIIAQC